MFPFIKIARAFFARLFREKDHCRKSRTAFPLPYVVIPKGIAFSALELVSSLSERSGQPCRIARCLLGDLSPRNNNHRVSSNSKDISGYSYQFTDRIVPKFG